ncbi:MAG: hypothetical protein RL173_2212 [Fibrobacterota bacterium]|jgi:hypothetical protein
MKKILAAAALLASMTMALETRPVPVNGDTGIVSQIRGKLDSLKQADSALFHEAREERRVIDSALFAGRLPDSIKAKIELHRKSFDSCKAEFDAVKPVDTAKIAKLKVKADSLRKSWVAKRDTQIAKIQDTAVQAKVKARVAEISAKREAVKAKIEARKATIEAKIAELKAKIEAAKAAK